MLGKLVRLDFQQFGGEDREDFGAHVGGVVEDAFEEEREEIGDLVLRLFWVVGLRAVGDVGEFGDEGADDFDDGLTHWIGLFE